MPQADLPDKVRYRTVINRGAKRLHYYLNCNDDARQVIHYGADGQDLLRGKPTVKGGTIDLPAWEVAIIAEA